VNDLENLHYYGYRGEALASLRDITSVLEINSRSQSSTQTYCKIFQQGKSIQISDSTIPRSSAGTTITVYDLFYNLPVRKKCCNPSLDLEKVRQKIEGIALIKPAVSFSLRNDVTGNVILQTHKTNSILNTFTYLFSPARSKSLTEVDGKEGNFSVQGYIGKSGSNKKDYQFIYINGRLVLKTKLHKTVNRQLSKSLILRKKLELTSSRFRGRIMTTSPTKTTDQHAIFVLNVVCPYKEYDITFEPAKTLVEFKDFEVLQHCLENMITDFLKRENLHLGILMENFGKKEMTKSPSNGNNSDEEIDEVKDQDQNVGLKLKPEIRTTDRNGLFSKVVKRKIIPETVVDRDENCDSQSSSSDTREIIATENNDPNTSSELNVKVLQKGNSETNKTVNSKSSSTNTLDNLKTPQNKIAVLNLCPNIHVPDNSENKNVDQELSGNKQNDPHVIIVNSNMDEKIDVDDEEKIYVTSRDSCSEGELSEDPLPTEQRKQPLPQRKQLICIDTPIVREAKINISALSKLRKRKSTEDCTSLAKSLEKHQKFTKLKEMDRDDSLGGEKTKGNLLLGKRSLEKTTISNEGEVNENNPTHNSESIMTSSLQGLRKFRAKENKSNANIEGNNNGQSLKYSLQELRKHRAQTASTSNCDRTKEDSFKDILQDRNLTGTSFSTSKNISEKVVRFEENKHMVLDSRQPDQSESRQRLLDSRQPDQSESRQRLLDSIQSSQSDESRQRLLDSIQSGQSESRQRLLDSIQSDQSESWQRQLDSIQSDQSESWQRQLNSIQSDQSESRQTQLDNRQSDQSESKQRQLDSRQSDQSESRQRHNAGDSESCENDKTNLLKREDNKFSEFIENKRKSTIDNLSFSNASEMFVDLPPGPDSYKESSGLKENCQISKHLVQAQTTMVSQKQMGILSNDSGNISSPIDIDEACQSLENCITEIENVISSSEKERAIATDMSQQIPTSLLTATISNSGDGIGSNVFANRTKSFMSSDQMIQTAQTFMEKYEDDQKRDSVEKCGKNKSNNNMSQDLQMDMKKQAALDVDIRYVAQPILHSNKLFNVDDRVQASESLGIDSSSESMTQDMFSSDCSQGEVPLCSYRKAKSFETSKSRTRNADNFMSENSYQQELNNRSMFTLTEHNLNLSKAMNSLENKERVLPSQSISFLSYFDVDGSNNLPGTQQKSEITTVQDTKLPFEIYLKHMQKNVKMTSSDETDDFLLCRESMKEIDELQTCFGQTQEFLVAEDSCIVTEYKDMDTSDTEENEIGIEFVHNVPVFERKMTISPCLSEGFSPAMDTENDIDSTGSKNVEEMTPVELSNTCRQYINSSLNNCLSSLKDYSDSRTEVPLSPQNKVGCIDIVPTISESAASVDSNYFSSAKLVQSESLHQSESKGERLSGTRLTCKKSFEDISGSSNSERTTICSGTTFDKSAELFSNYSLTGHQNSDTSSSCLESQNKHVHTENNLKSQNVSDSNIFNIMISHRSEVHNEGFIKTASNMENKVSNAHSNEEMMSSEKCEDENNDEEMFSLDGDREICEISHQTQSNDKMTGVVTSTPCSARKGDTDELFSPDGDCQLRDVQYESKTWVEMTDPKSG
jgi:DNA mismatch repair protein MLH3